MASKKGHLRTVEPKKYRPSPGRDFEGAIEIRKVEVDTARATSSTRDFIAKTTVIVFVAALATATVLGIKDGEFSKLQLVWNIGPVFLGCVFATYMKGSLHRKDDG